MRINNTSIQGFFSYLPTVHYETGDFVVSGRSIYVCSIVTPGLSTVIGELPSTSENFYIYLGEQMAGVRDYEEFLETGGGANKYISLSTLPGILNIYMQGITGKGIIGDKIEYSPGTYDIIMSEESKRTRFTDFNTVLSEILVSSDINHAVFRVSRKLPEIVLYVGTAMTSSINQTDLDSVVLRQYTYKDNLDNSVRVQELIDHVDGQIFYRSAYVGQSVESVIGSGFIPATVNTESLRQRAKEVFSVYSSKIQALDALRDDLKGNFRFRRVLLPAGENTVLVLQNTDPGAPGYLRVPDIRDLSGLTMTLYKPKYGGLAGSYETYESSIDPSSTIETYYIYGNMYVTVSTSITGGSGQGTVTLTLGSSTGTIDPGLFIESVFYQEYFR